MVSIAFVSLLFTPWILCQDQDALFPQEEYKCALPDVTTLDSNLDVTRFRSDFSKISEMDGFNQYCASVCTEMNILY